MQRHFRHSSKLQLEMAFDVEVRDHVGVKHSFEAMGHTPFGSVKRQSLERVQEVLVNIRNHLLRLTDTQVALAGAVCFMQLSEHAASPAIQRCLNASDFGFGKSFVNLRETDLAHLVF